jgi:hypothetical protein
VKNIKNLNRKAKKECARKCQEHKIACPFKECRMWIDFKEDYNCANIAIAANGNMTLRQIAEREGLSFVRIQQIEKKALKKLKFKLQ